MLHGYAERDARRVGERLSAVGVIGHAECHLGHDPVGIEQALADRLLVGLIPHHPHTGEGTQGLACDVVLGRSYAAGQNHRVGAHRCIGNRAM